MLAIKGYPASSHPSVNTAEHAFFLAMFKGELVRIGQVPLPLLCDTDII